MTNVEMRLTYVNFNYNSTTLIVGTKEEIKIFRLEDFKIIWEKKIGYAHLIEQPFGTNVICVILKSEPNKLKILELSSNGIGIKSYNEDVFAIKSNKSVIIVGTRNTICIYSNPSMKGLCVIDLLFNPGIIALSQCLDVASYLAFPKSETTGIIEIIDVQEKSKVTEIRAHNSAIATMVFHPTQQILATASIKGTVIRLVSVPCGTNLYEFRRGLQRNAEIYSLSFSLDSNMLISSGSTGTVHLFKFTLPWEKSSETCGWSGYLTDAIKSSANYLLAPSSDLSVKQNQGWKSYFGSMISSSANFVPKHVYEMCTQARSFLKIKLPIANMRTLSTMTRINGVPRVAVFTEDSFLSIYDIEGNTYKLTTKYSPVTGMTSTEILEASSVAENEEND